VERGLLAIVGPTATGKSEVGVLVAEALGGEIMSADSMQVYRGLDIGTAKLTPGQRARVPHHLVDIVDPDEPFSVADYRARADAALEDIWERGRQPILVGGSGLYVRAVIEEMDFSYVPPDRELRRQLTDEARAKGLAVLHERLLKVDPAAAARIHPNDEKRIIRALEVAQKREHHPPSPSPRAERGRTPEGGRRRETRGEVHADESDSMAQPAFGTHARAHPAVDQPRATRYNTMEFGLTLARDELYRRIEARVDAMLAAGLVDEVRGLLGHGYPPELVSMKGLGYAQMVPYLRGEVSLDDAVSRLKRDTRRFAKRQLTWFRADPRIRWIDVEQAGGPPGVASVVVEGWRSG
jgi:tRNA dimethylallyltransferase